MRSYPSIEIFLFIISELILLKEGFFFVINQYLMYLQTRHCWIMEPQRRKQLGKREYHPLHRACWVGNVKKARCLIEKDVSLINQADDNESTPLTCVIEGRRRDEAGQTTSNRIKLMKLLLDKGAIYNDALRLAVEKDFKEAVQLILEREKDIEAIKKIYRDHISVAAKFSSVDIVRAILRLRDTCGFSSRNKKRIGEEWDPESFSVYLALRRGNFDIVELMLENIEYFPEKIPHVSDTALHWAAKYGNVKMMVLLLNRGFHPDGLGTDCRPADSPLHFAADSGNYEAVTLLISKGADPFIKGNNAHSAVHCAARGGNIYILKYLVELGVPWNRPDRNDMIPLYYAAQEGHLNLVIYLLELGASISEQNHLGRTCLHYSAEGKSKINSENSSKGNNFDVFRYLLDKNCDASLPDSVGNSCLHLATDGSQFDIVKFIVESHIVSVECKNNDLQTALHRAAINGNTDILKFLLENNADADSPDHRGRTALHLAVIYGNSDAVELLLPYVQDIDVRDNYSQTPLGIHFNDINWKERIVELLLFNGASIYCAEYCKCLYQMMNTSEITNFLILPCLIDFGLNKTYFNPLYEKSFEEIRHYTNFQAKYQFHYSFYKIIAANVVVSFMDENESSYDWLLDNFRFRMCLQEVDKMKENRLCQGRSFYDFFISPLKPAATLLTNPWVEEELRNTDIDEEFPIYADLLRAKYRRASHLKYLIERATTFFTVYVDIDPGLNYHCVDLILDYLRIKDLVTLSKLIK